MKRQKPANRAKTLASQCAGAIAPCLVLILLLTAGSCKKSCEDKSIIGSWKLVELKYPPYTDYGNQIVVNYTDSNIIFIFKENNSLLITGNMQGGYLPEGEYSYRYCVIVNEKNMPECGYGYDCVSVAGPLSDPGPNLTINGKPGFANVSEQATKLGTHNDEWSIKLIKR
ncbi:MAG: hypothetical protein LBL18_06500 [Bacteroidales bacterium]|nr:hypothetical protein [Bacteroidales bacterium]